ncbi:hypothetical protein BCR43DRAFT_434917 [Syncephalastrum racemosum]|uniref:Uncharacterized protein n=1 Tax=Syncephalastrum racemosum TaxID=13706 RepID=A0A1X2HLJ8_SYNRA|nr:hypothetical protein BCR43DRAFT_434917 [Syncephalastrum racemosum]
MQSSDDLARYYKRPRHFTMDVYSRPNYKGSVQHMRTRNGATSSCFNILHKHVGSIAVNDPIVKLQFYRSSDCHGAPTSVTHGSLGHNGRNNNLQLRARSVSVTKLRPVLLLD